MKNNKISSSGFFDSKLSVQILKAWFVNNDIIHLYIKKDYYNIIYFRKGNFFYYYDNKRFNIDDGTVIVCKNIDFEKIKTNYSSFDNFAYSEVIAISLHPTLFSSFKDFDKFYRVFMNSKISFEKNIYVKDCFYDFDLESNIFKNIDKYVKNNMSLISFSGIISTLITELNLIFDKRNKTNDLVNTFDFKAKVFDYISKSFMQDITLESVASRFSVSKFFVEQVTKQYYSHTFRNTIKNMRMWHARELMKNSDALLLFDIAQLCGYKDYSGFFKAYSQFFKISPKKDYNHYIKNKKFLSYEY